MRLLLLPLILQLLLLMQLHWLPRLLLLREHLRLKLLLQLLLRLLVRGKHQRRLQLLQLLLLSQTGEILELSRPEKPV
jgi:hypothetical protein